MTRSGRILCAGLGAHDARFHARHSDLQPRRNSLRHFWAILRRENADCRVLVLDSSGPEVLAANRERVAASSLDVEFAEFPDLEPIEKWRQGIHKVTTPFCALCADDDLVILEGVQRCLD